MARETDVITDKKYQGKEITTYIQAPDEATLNNMIADIYSYAEKDEMDDIKIALKQKDPDGGWEAIVKAHNDNIFQQIKQKWESRGGGKTERENRKKSEHRLAMIKRKLEAEEKEVELQARILKAREAQKSQRIMLRRSTKGRKSTVIPRGERPSIISITIHKEKKPRRISRRRGIALPRTKPQNTLLYKKIVG